MLSFGTAGCNLTCRFCQNWDISKSRETDTLADAATPRADRPHGAGASAAAASPSRTTTRRSSTSTPRDTAIACHELGVRTVAVTAGYMSPGPRAELFAHIDAANVDLKAFDEDIYHRICSAHLAPVLDTIEYLVAETASGWS